MAGVWALSFHLATDPLADVRAYYDAGARLNAGQPLYLPVADTNVPGSYHYPPLLAIVFRPLALLPYGPAAIIWEAVVVGATILTFVRLGFRRAVLISAGLLAMAIAWTVAIGQAQALVTYLLAIGAPWAVALATNLKLYPALVAVYWVGRRQWRRLGWFAAWLAAILVVQFVLEPAATIAYIGFLADEQVKDANNLSLFALSPILWVISLVVLGTRGPAPGAIPLGLGRRGRSVRSGGAAAPQLSTFDAARRVRRTGRGRMVRSRGDQRRPPARRDRPVDCPACYPANP